MIGVALLNSFWNEGVFACRPHQLSYAIERSETREIYQLVNALSGWRFKLWMLIQPLDTIFFMTSFADERACASSSRIRFPKNTSARSSKRDVGRCRPPT